MKCEICGFEAGRFHQKKGLNVCDECVVRMELSDEYQPVVLNSFKVKQLKFQWYE